MISIVVVSHSRALGEAAVGLAVEMVGGGAGPTIKVAAGLDEATFGTDAAAVADAITAADTPDGVLVLVDLGSAVLSAEMALEFLEAGVAERVTVTGAALVEGLVAAVATASTGADMAAVVDEARNGLAAKQRHLGDSVGPSLAGSADPVEAERSGPTPSGSAPSGRAPSDPGMDDARGVDLDVANAHGLHARPAARLVALVRSFDTWLSLTNLDTGRGPVDARSLSRVATLDAREGHTLRAVASGPDADKALAALVVLAADDFGDAARPAPTDATGATSAGSGLDVAIGPAAVASAEVDVSAYRPGASGDELDRSEVARARARETLSTVRRGAEAEGGPDRAAIFDAHLTLLDDDEVTEPVASEIRRGTSAPRAWSTVLRRLAGEFESLPDAYQRERAQDVRSVERRLLLALMGRDEDAHPRRGDTPVVLVLSELDAAAAASLDPVAVVGVVTIGGGATGHGVIVAKSRGIPVITDVGAAAAVTDGDVVAFDAAVGRFVVNPDAAETAEIAALVEQRTRLRRQAVAAATEPATTRDGTGIRVFANVASVDDARAAVSQGAEGSGLVRTEVLFGELRSAPTADEQLERFLAVSAALGGRPVTIRTWDAGGDKPLAFLPSADEPNPFLGVRGIRLFRNRPDQLVEQLTAVCRLAAQAPTKVMFPMVTTRAEVDWGLERLHEAAARSGRPVPDGLEVGVMVEVPAAALRVADLARGLDFVSVGTNDLTQYTTAAERGNAAVSTLADPFDPAVLRLLRIVCDEVPETTTVAVCGDLASDVSGVVLLVGLGVRELSAVAPAVPLVKQRLRRIDLADARRLAAEAVSASDADEVRALLEEAGTGLA